MFISSRFLSLLMLLSLLKFQPYPCRPNILVNGMALMTSSSNTMTTTNNNDNPGPLELYYFGVFARVASLFALEHSGLDYVYKSPGNNWKELKPTLAWKCLPCLKNLPAGHTTAFAGGEIGQETAILYYIAAACPSTKLKGDSFADELISQQLLGEGEDIYNHLANIKGNLVSHEQALTFWSKDAQDPNSHNKRFGIYVILGLLENFYRNCNGGHSGGGGTGKFTESGCTVGECKLFSSLHCVFMIDPSVFDDPQFTGVNTFYQRFKALPETQTILNDRKNVFQQYFLKPEEGL